MRERGGGQSSITALPLDLLHGSKVLLAIFVGLFRRPDRVDEPS